MEDLKYHIDNTEFDYLVTYTSLERSNLPTVRSGILAEIQIIKDKISVAPIRERMLLKNGLVPLNEFIQPFDLQKLQSAGKMQIQGHEIGKYERGTPQFDNIVKILTTPCHEQALSRCFPVYRDSIAFFTDNHICTNILYLCFGCTSIISDNAEFAIDKKVFPLLMAALKEIGHPIEERYW